MTKIFDIPSSQMPGPGDWLPRDEPECIGFCDECGQETDLLVAVGHDGDREYGIFICSTCQRTGTCDACDKRIPLDELEHSPGSRNGAGDADFCGACMDTSLRPLRMR